MGSNGLRAIAGLKPAAAHLNRTFKPISQPPAAT